MGKRRKASVRGKRKGVSKASSSKTSATPSINTSSNSNARRRGRPRKVKEALTSSNSIPRRRGRPRKTKEALSPTTSDTSPFKGFNLDCVNSDCPNDKENLEGVKLFEDKLEIVEDKNTMFDSLLDPHNRSKFPNKNIRTYSNKKRLSDENKLFEFQDCKNRDSIVQWLTDTRNVFDRLTQTQCDSASDNNQEVPVTLDMPSISQVDTRITRSSMKSKKKSRARSLDIRIKKNGSEGRSKRHSLAGDTPSMENYHIEEVVTDEELPVPAEKIIVDLMEDEYLNNIEKEMMQHVDKESGKKNQSVKGWDRMKDFNKSINNLKKKPKQLKIRTLHCSDNKKGGTLMNNSGYNVDELENYFIENMEKLIAKGKEGYPPLSCSQVTENSLMPCLQDVVTTGNNFLTMLKKVSEKCNHQELVELKPVVSEIKEIFTKLNFVQNTTCDIAMQTLVLESINRGVQTQTYSATAETQTEDLYKCQNCANNEIIKNNKVTDLLLLDKFVQTEEKQVTVEVPVVPVLQQNQQIVRVITESSTPSGLSLEEEMENIITPEDCETNNVDVRTAENEFESLDVCFNTEDIVKAAVSRVDEKTNTEVDNKQINLKSGACKGVKRFLPKSPHSICEELQPKRPCNKFINEDLSVDFMSCAESEDPTALNEEPTALNEEPEAPNEEPTVLNEEPEALNEEPKAPIEVITLSGSSDDVYFEQYLDQVMKKFEDDVPPKREVEPAPAIDKSQEQIEEYEALIRNATKPCHSANQNKRQQQQQRPIPTTNSDAIFKEAAEITMSKFEKDLDYFKTEITPKSSRKCLFDTKKIQKSNQFSESLFFSDQDETIIGLEEDIANRTITQDNVDALVKEIGRHSIDGGRAADNEVENILGNEAPKVNIIQNIVVKGADHVCTPKNEIGFSEDVDIVESTPQKNYGSFSERRAESVLDITLPPPLEFQDVEMVETENLKENLTKQVKRPSPSRPPLATINKITSTPITQNHVSEKISLSPITLDVNRNLNPIEMAQRSKFSPLTIVKKTASQKSFHGTPKQKSILNYMRPSQETQESPKTPLNRPCVSCSRISRDQVMGISAMANKKLASYSSSFTSKVTHMVVSVDSRNQLKEHTVKSVSAIAAGIWVLSYGWVRECLAKNCIVAEEPYEVLDFSGIPGPKMARLNRKTNPLLKGFKVHVLPPFQAIPKKDLENILTMLGARVVDSLEDLLDKENYICLVIGDRRPTEECPVDMFDRLVEVFKVITVDVDWLSRSVGQYSLHGLRPFTLCSEDDIDNLGYPPELLSDSVSISLLQSTSSVPSL